MVPGHHRPSCALLIITSTHRTPWTRSPHCSHGLNNASMCKWAQLPNCCTWFFFLRVVCQQCSEAPSWMMKQTEASRFSVRNLKKGKSCWDAEALRITTWRLVMMLCCITIWIIRSSFFSSQCSGWGWWWWWGVTDTSVALNTQSINQALHFKPVSNQSSGAFGSRWATRQGCLALSKFLFVDKNG